MVTKFEGNCFIRRARKTCLRLSPHHCRSFWWWRFWHSLQSENYKGLNTYPSAWCATSLGFTWLVFFSSPFSEGIGRFLHAFSAFVRKYPRIFPCFSTERALGFFGKGVDGVDERVGATVCALDSSDGFGAPSFRFLIPLNNFWAHVRGCKFFHVRSFVRYISKILPALLWAQSRSLCQWGQESASTSQEEWGLRHWSQA